MALFIFLFIVAIIICFVSLVIVPQGSSYVTERLGKYKSTWMAGVHFKLPILDRISRKVLIKEQVADFAPQPVITKDNVTMMIDSVVYFKIIDPKLYAYGVENPIMAMENLTATTLRNIIGDMELDTTLTSREDINSKMLETIDAATDPWGIKVTRVELKNIQPPAAIREAMEKQMKAEREKRAAILTAEGEKQAMILQAEGHKESAVLNAEAEKQAMILKAEGEKQEAVLRAEGQAAAIKAMEEAKAVGLDYIKQSKADETVVKLKALEAFAKAADGQATKIIIPSEIASLAGLAKSVSESVK